MYIVVYFPPDTLHMSATTCVNKYIISCDFSCFCHIVDVIVTCGFLACLDAL